MKKRITDFKFEIKFGYGYDIITLKVCEHYHLQSFVPDKDFYARAKYLIDNSSFCPVCGKKL